ncbi:RILP-like protein homolog isoform X3 [Varroa jacobsoni]|uniref:RH1 domain-containing protein n=1 Tax=Varroa destructor TaxID=109461 RepID=A0A7M7KMA9_VARDE|nr:RILP-like protein homolog isoform X3 [Varroa destructor]XP_022699465.1 RILP-like protein homolog isoform X3 [Varroa jacobsoni]
MDGNAHLLSKCSTQEDVYALSADIGQEVERLVDGFGVDAASSLVPKLIRVLELLEAAVQQNETLRGEADQLFQTVCQLEYDKKEKAQFRKKFDQELEQIEDMWRSEMNDLSGLVSRLQEENSRLSTSLREKTNLLGEGHDDSDRSEGHFSRSGVTSLADSSHGGGGPDSGVFTNGGLSQSDIDMLNRLKEAFNKQASQLHSYESELAQRLTDIQSLKHQVERLRRSGLDSVQRVRQLELQLGRSADEREHLIRRLDEEQREKEQLRQEINKEKRDAQDELLEAVIRLSPPSPTEYKKMCQEKKELEARVRFLEGELEFYKPPVAKTPSEDSGGEETEAPESSRKSRYPPDDVDLPVQGPINREPEDKLDYSDFSHGGSSLSIKRFFPKLLWSSRRS